MKIKVSCAKTSKILNLLKSVFFGHFLDINDWSEYLYNEYTVFLFFFVSWVLTFSMYYL